MNSDVNVHKNAERTEDMRVVAPPVDVYENQERLLLLADMPGVDQEGISIRFEKNQLTLEGRVPAIPNVRSKFLYSRSFLVPGSIDADQISAELKKGVVTVVLPRKAAHRPRQIPVHSA